MSSRQSDGAGADTGPEEDIGGGSVIRARVKCTVAVLAGGNYRRQHQQDVCCQTGPGCGNTGDTRVKSVNI